MLLFHALLVDYACVRSCGALLLLHDVLQLLRDDYVSYCKGLMKVEGNNSQKPFFNHKRLITIG